MARTEATATAAEAAAAATAAAGAPAAAKEEVRCFQLRQSVEARFQAQEFGLRMTKWFPGEITAVHADGTYDIE